MSSSEQARGLRVVLVADHASMRIGGEASLPAYYFKLLRKRGVECWMVLHDRYRDELRELFGEDFGRVRFVPDTWVARTLWKLGQVLPTKVDEQTLEVVRHVRTQLAERRVVRRLIAEHNVDVVHEVEPISPKQVSMMYGLGVPVVIGPMCGGMSYPPAFADMQGKVAGWVEDWGRLMAQGFNWLFPGKLRADALVVANEETRKALPRGTRGMVYEVVESGVDLSIWNKAEESERAGDGTVRFVFMGRMIPLKGTDLLLEAFAGVARRTGNAMLEFVGDGEMRPALEQRVRELGIGERVRFTGWVERSEGARRLRTADAMVLPSLRECGGTAILEAMAMGVPVIATWWGGPGNYVTEECGIRVRPDSREGFIKGLEEAMVRIAGDGELRKRLSEGARRRVESVYFDWEAKTDRMLEIYRETVKRARAMEEMELAEPVSCC